MSTPATQLDPILIEVLHNNLLSIADEMFYALMRSAYSTNIKERHDHSSCLIDARARAVALAPHAQPIHLASMQGQVRTIIEQYGIDGLHEGDMFISNDPYVAKGTHLPDINFAAPVFINGELIAFSCNVAHHADVGGSAAGSMASNVEEIYQEGLRLPVVKLFDRGRMVDDILRIILLNVRHPVERRGDYNAQIASCRLGARRLVELATAHGAARLNAVFDTVIARSERRLRDAIGRLADGEYCFEDYIDDDGVGTHDIPIRLKVIIHGERCVFDFAGTSAQVKGNMNCPLPATLSAVSYALVALVDKEIACNEGIFDAIEVIAEQGSFVNPSFPVPVAARTHTTQRIVDVVLGALASAMPQMATAASNGANTCAFLSGMDSRNEQGYLYFETYGGGGGARSWKDGKDGVQCHIPNTANTPVEVLEVEFPVLVEEYCLAPDTGGAGKYRGGLALRRTMRTLNTSSNFNGAGERFRHQPWGLFGGHAGATGQFLLLDDDGTQTKLAPKPAPMSCGPEQRIVVQSPGAGGYGNASERDPQLLARDWRSDKYSSDFMREHYGLSEAELEALPFDDNGFDYAED
ncbi:MAG: N-methylhydantoinase B [Gammaproteobacteria bacterium]|jgi:N-methylhydantoinase B